MRAAPASSSTASRTATTTQETARVQELGGVRTTWTYDAAYQLKHEKRTGANAYDVTHVYDPAGNRTLQIDSDTRTTYTFDAANQLTLEQTGANRTTYTHDPCGNRTKKDAPSAISLYQWTEDNRLKNAEPPAGRVTMTYSAPGQRVQKQSPTQTTKFLYDFEKVLQETDGGGATTHEYTSTTEQYGDLLSAYDGSATSYYEHDALGSTDALINDAEAATDRYVYRAYGLNTQTQGSTAQPFQYVGQKSYFRDLETDLYFLNARYYDPATARFVSEDPIGYQDDVNLYRYVRNNPINGIDPSGKALLIPFEDIYRCPGEDQRLSQALYQLGYFFVQDFEARGVSSNVDHLQLVLK